MGNMTYSSNMIRNAFIRKYGEICDFLYFVLAPSCGYGAPPGGYCSGGYAAGGGGGDSWGGYGGYADPYASGGGSVFGTGHGSRKGGGAMKNGRIN